LTLAEWLEAKEILREKYKSDPNEIKNEDFILARLNFLLKIQTLNNQKTRFRQVKNDLQMMIKQQEDRLNLANSNNDEIDILSHTNHIKETIILHMTIFTLT
jgi:putative transposase